jgi:hypothetical protein
VSRVCLTVFRIDHEVDTFTHSLTQQLPALRVSEFLIQAGERSSLTKPTLLILFLGLKICAARSYTVRSID